MHVEALNWSGSTAKDYAKAHHISVCGLRTWRCASMQQLPRYERLMRS
jgi:hypothetical protein